MSPDGGRPPSYTVHCAGQISAAFLQIQHQAAQAGRGREVLTAMRAVVESLQGDPVNFGELLYRLPALKLRVFIGVVSPLVVHFAVHDQLPLVVLKGVSMLPEPGRKD
jgi:hypothetical protein